MNKILIGSLVLISSISMAQTKISSGKASVYSSARSWEVVIDGPAATTLFDTLEVEPVVVSGYLNKVTDHMVCGKNLSNGLVSCSMSVDENGIQ